MVQNSEDCTPKCKLNLKKKKWRPTLITSIFSNLAKFSLNEKQVTCFWCSWYDTISYGDTIIRDIIGVFYRAHRCTLICYVLITSRDGKRKNWRKGSDKNSMIKTSKISLYLFHRNSRTELSSSQWLISTAGTESEKLKPKSSLKFWQSTTSYSKTVIFWHKSLHRYVKVRQEISYHQK